MCILSIEHHARGGVSRRVLISIIWWWSLFRWVLSIWRGRHVFYNSFWTVMEHICLVVTYFILFITIVLANWFIIFCKIICCFRLLSILFLKGLILILWCHFIINFIIHWILIYLWLLVLILYLNIIFFVFLLFINTRSAFLHILLWFSRLL